jgi:hypothetical protein
MELNQKWQLRETKVSQNIWDLKLLKYLINKKSPKKGKHFI